MKHELNNKITILYVDENKNRSDFIIRVMKHSLGFPISFLSIGQKYWMSEETSSIPTEKIILLHTTTTTKHIPVGYLYWKQRWRRNDYLEKQLNGGKDQNHGKDFFQQILIDFYRQFGPNKTSYHKTGRNGMGIVPVDGITRLVIGVGLQ